jgi:phosphatidate cytidylyltransferase
MNIALKKVITGLVFGIVFFTILLFFQSIYFSSLLVLIALICSYEFYRLFPFNKLWLFLILPFYPLFSFFLMILMSLSGKEFQLLLLFSSVFAFDTGAYFFGKKLGKHKISKISPNKTWEGFFGGLLLMFLVLIISSLIYFNAEYFAENFLVEPYTVIINLYNSLGSITIWFSIFMSISIGTLAQIGDLFESWFKRRSGIKDSGILLPGHGGFLDRFDAVIFVTPFVYLLFS